MNFEPGRKKKEREKALREKQDVIMELPGFLNQVLLLMDSGLILRDAFMNVAGEYGSIPEAERGFFRDRVLKMAVTSNLTGEDVISLFYEFSCRTDVKELKKAGNFLYENRNRGTEIWERLSELSEGLWQERKRLCLERMRVAETKMSFPLGIMLISLILMTSAPAVMQIT
ncbi:MAG: hypothetical protein K6D56_07960 [Clostridia bacterium]|nr:hypothetical protein [Clostridia bacterium]